MVKRIHIVGRRNSGKTTLITELVTYLTNLGYRVGTIKHTHHQHELDTPGKDSHRHREAGAAVVGILSPTMSAVFRPVKHNDRSTDRYGKILPMFTECDLVLVEGDLGADAPKIEVWRAATNADLLAANDQTSTAVVSDDLVELAVPLLSRSDVPGLADYLLRLATKDACAIPATVAQQDAPRDRIERRSDVLQQVPQHAAST